LFGDRAKQDDWRGASEADHAPSDQAFFAPPKAHVEAIPDDWDLGVPLAPSPTPVPKAAPTRPAARPQPPESEGFAEASPAPRPPVPVPAAPHRAQSPALAPSPAEEGAIAGFLTAAGLAGTTLSDAEKTTLLRLAGEALAVTVQGLTEILAARSTTKQEFRIERTTIGAMGNNPLKFSASLDEAMRVMLLGRVPGFLTATQAIEEALGDIKSHQLAVLAGMQVALTTVIARFDPAKLEQRLEQSSLIEGILPGAPQGALLGAVQGALQGDRDRAGGRFPGSLRRRVSRAPTRSRSTSSDRTARVACCDLGLPVGSALGHTPAAPQGRAGKSVSARTGDSR